MAKPRTNADACDHWASFILENELGPASLDVNSIELRGDTIYSFGRHFPMAKMVRDANGRVVRVVLNSDTYTGANGWANTGQDQWSVRTSVESYAAKARWSVKVERIPLTSYSYERVQVLPKNGDPKPPYPYPEIPTFFCVSYPGDEPVDDGVGCIAGSREEYSYQTEDYGFSLRPEKWLGHPVPTYADSTGLQHWKYVRAANGWIVYGAKNTWWDDDHYAELASELGYCHEGTRYVRSQVPNVEYKQCSHCAAFRAKHERWSLHYNGGVHYGGPSYKRQRVRGYKLYREMMDTYGSERGWREARRDDWRRVKRGRQALKEWEERNFIDYRSVPRDEHDIPIVTYVPGDERTPYVRRKDAEAFFQAERERERMYRRLQREQEEEERVRRIARRALERRRRARERSHPFEMTAERVVHTLRNFKGAHNDGLES